MLRIWPFSLVNWILVREHLKLTNQSLSIRECLCMVRINWIILYLSSISWIPGFNEVDIENRTGTCSNDTISDDGQQIPATIWNLSDQSETWIFFEFATNNFGQALIILDCVSIISSGEEDNNANQVAPVISVDGMFDTVWQQLYISHSKFDSVGGIYFTNTSATGTRTAPVMLQYATIVNPQGPLFDCTLFVCDVNLYNISVTNSSWPLFEGVAQSFDRMAHSFE